MGFKPMTSGTGILRSIQLNYGANKLIAKMQPASAKKVYFQFAECSYILCKGTAKFAIGKIYLLQNTAQNECKDL